MQQPNPWNQQGPPPPRPGVYPPQAMFPQQFYPPQPMFPQQLYQPPPPQQQMFFPPPTQVVPPKPQPSIVTAAPPVTSSNLASVPMNVFVGKLPLTVHDTFVEALLKQCGAVLKWKRTVDTETNKAKAFGFCTFADATGATRAVEVLNDLPLLGQKVLVKVGKKEQAIIDALPAANTEAASRGIRQLLESADPTKPYGGGPASLQPSSKGQAPLLRPPTVGLSSSSSDSAEEAHQQMIAEEMEKFRSKQAQRDKELEEERRRKLQAKVQESLRAESKKHDSDHAKAFQPPSLSQHLGFSGGNNSSSSSSSRHHQHRDQQQKKRPAANVVLEAASPASAIGERSSKLGFGIKKTKSDKPSLKSPAALFAVDAPPPRPLKTLDDDDDDERRPGAPPSSSSSSEQQPAEEEQRRDRAIAESIPTDREALFAMPVDWAAVEKKGIVRQKLRPWVAKKMTEYLGEEEPTLIDFVATQLEARAAPQKIVQDLALVLEDDAQVLVVKLWRVLHFHAAK